MKALLKIFVFLFLCLGGSSTVLADGSKDMYPAGVAGNRAYLVSGTARVAGAGGHDRFLNNGVHYVYAQSFEVIAVASSAMGIGEGNIILTSPNGTVYYASSSSNGRIRAGNGLTSRAAELAGPGVGYEPYEVSVGIGEEGVWKVEFIGTGSKDNIDMIPAANDWRQDEDSRCIAAWDISVRKQASTSWIKGRVYANLLNLYIHQNSISNVDGGLYAQNYVLTKDGYVYRVNANGSHPAKFTYFVNSTGILDGMGNPTYKSSNDGYVANVQDPNLPDRDIHVTHKMFYTFPDLSMPEAASVFTIEQSYAMTWLVNSSSIVPEVSDIVITPIEGDANSIITKGTRIGFNVTVPGSYRITISPADEENYPFAKRYIPVQVTQPHHEYIWDGLDGNQQLIPVGDNYPINISISAMEGEIHFPYFDMEINPNGILVERMNPDDTHHSFATMYWDDTEINPGFPSEVFDIVSGPEGIPSNINGHKWGNAGATRLGEGLPSNAGTGSYSFGNEKAMDTWSFAVQAFEERAVAITVLVSDLEIVRITTAQDTIEPGDLLTYQVVARNNGPSDAIGAGFEFRLPEGLHIENATITSDCNAARENELTIDGGRMEAVLDIPNGCTFSYKITARTSSIIPDATYGYLLAEAGIVRPLGYTDPDATLADRRQTAPLSAWEECNDGCNNIKANDVEVFLLEYEHERGHLALVKTVEQVSPVDPGFFNLGDLLRYTFTITNIGPTNGVWVGEIQIEDPMLSSTPILPPNRRLGLGESTTVSREYRITQADLDRKYVENTATVFGKNPRGFTVKDISGTDIDNAQPTRIILDKKPYLKLKKTVRNRGTGEDGQFTIGDKIIYRFEIKHEGDIPVEKMNIIDEKLQSDPISVPTASILNRTFTFESGYEITAKDILQGTVTNSATLQGHDTKYGNFLEDISGLSFEDDFPTVTTLAQPPMAVDDKFEIYQGNIGVFDVLSNDVLGSSRLDANSIEIVGHPALGRVRAEGSKIHYEPADNYVYGTDNFSYRVRDRSRLYTEATTVTVEILRTIPVAVGDFTKIGYNYQGTLRPLSNDYVLHSQLIPESLEIIDYPRYGQVVNQGEGVLRYTPDHNYTGYDNIVYRVRDKNGNWSEPMTIKIEVAGFFIPNAFTPNDDNKNDRLEIIGIYQFDRVELEVIDRFGRQVFYSSDYNNDWAGRNSLDGHQLEEGTYFVTFKGIKAKEKPIVRRGTILITRDRLHSF